MKIPAGEQLPRLLARMAGGGADAAPGRAFGFIGAPVIAVDDHRTAEGGQQMRGILDPFGDQMGRGKRFLTDVSAPCELALVGTAASATGVLMNRYRPAGPLRTGTFPDPEV